MKRNPIKEVQDFKQISWLAGLLEGEGSFVFLKKTNRVRMALEMCDEDVVAKAAELLGVRYHRIAARERHHSTSYKFNVSGPRAGYYMRLILPHMGNRRTATIRACLSKIESSIELHRLRGKMLSEKVSDGELLERWQSRDKEISFRAFARSLGISSRTSLLKRIETLSVGNKKETNFEQSVAPFDYIAWLAGLLEGEAHFRVTPRTVQFVLKMTDEDIVGRAAKLLGRPYFIEKARKATHNDCFCLTVNGLKCVEVLHAIKPFMGQRRLERINEMIETFEARVSARDESRSALLQRWINRAPGETLVGIARTLGIKGTTYRARLVRAGVYETLNPRK